MTPNIKILLLILSTVAFAVLLQYVFSPSDPANYVKDQNHQNNPNWQNGMTWQFNNQPCLPTTNNNAYNNFKDRHILSQDISSTDRNVWTQYLTQKRLLRRTEVQTFFQMNDEQAVKDICQGGGKVSKNNLCVSNRQFDVFNVTIAHNNGHYVVKSVEKLLHPVVVACDVDNICLPVHYQKYGNQTPTNIICE